MHRSSCIAASILLLASPFAAQAAGCEESVVKSGSLLDGRQFAGHADIPRLSTSSAFAQLRAIFQLSRIGVVAEDVPKGLLWAQIGPSFLAKPIQIQSTSQIDRGATRLSLTYRIAPGEMSDGQFVRKHMCSILTQLRGANGEPPTSWTVVQKPPQVTSAAVVARVPLSQTISTSSPPPANIPQVIAVEAATLARQLVKVMSNPARIDADYVGRWYRVNGSVLKITPAYGGYAVWFEGEPQTADQRSGLETPGMAIRCLVPKAKIRAAANLTVGTRGALMGRFESIDDNPRAPAVVLVGCDGA